MKVYVNHADDAFRGFKADTARLDRAVVDHVILDETKSNPIIAALEDVFEQLNVGGDLVEAKAYTTRYREYGNRSLSVGDVVVLGETAWAVGRFGWDQISGEDVHQGMLRFLGGEDKGYPWG